MLAAAATLRHRCSHFGPDCSTLLYDPSAGQFHHSGGSALNTNDRQHRAWTMSEKAGFALLAILAASSPFWLKRPEQVLVQKSVPVLDQATLTLKGHGGAINSVVFSPDGKRLASAGSGQNIATMPGEVKIWDA